MITNILILASAAVASPLKLTYVEKLQIREATVHEESFNSRSSVTQTEQRGSFGLEAQFDGDFTKLSPDSEISVKFGKFSYSGKLSDDGSYKTDRKNATLRSFADRTAAVKYITSVVDLKWSPTRMTLKVSGKIPDSPSPVAATIPAGGSDKFMGQTEITARVGTVDLKTTLDFSGTFKRKELARGNVTGSETNIDLKGKL